MVKAVTQRFDQLVLEVETDTPGTFTKLCGLVGVSVTRTATVVTTEVPDCDDESLPHHTDREVTALDVSVSATGVWSQNSWPVMNDWFYSGAPKNIRIKNTGAAVGAPEIESGPALLVTQNNARAKGEKVSAEIEIQFSGTPSRTDKAA